MKNIILESFKFQILWCEFYIDWIIYYGVRGWQWFRVGDINMGNYPNPIHLCSGTQGTPKIPNTKSGHSHKHITDQHMMFVMWLKPSRGKHSMAPAKLLLGAIYHAKEIKLHELLIIDQLAKDPLWFLNRAHKPIGC